MMATTGLCEMDSVGDYFTWSNKHRIGTIYSRIDRVLGKLDWYQVNMEAVLKILPPNISGHALLCVVGKVQMVPRKIQFRFSNCITESEGYDDVVREC